MAVLAALPYINTALAAFGAYRAYKGSKKKGHGSSGGFSGEDPSTQKYEAMTGTEKKLYKKILKRIDPKSFDLSRNPTFMAGSNFINEMLNPNSEAYKKFEAPYIRQFQEQIVPKVAEGFLQYDAQNSSGFNQAMAHASTDLSERLASMRTQAMMQMVPQAGQFGTAQANVYGNLYGQSLSANPFGYQQNQGTPGWGSSFMQGVGSAAPGIFKSIWDNWGKDSGTNAPAAPTP